VQSRVGMSVRDEGHWINALLGLEVWQSLGEVFLR